jgi:hypothetical protein
MSEWISVDEGLPGESHDTLLVAVVNEIGKLFVDTDAFYLDEQCFRFWGQSERSKVTHWMPLPEPPVDL